MKIIYGIKKGRNYVLKKHKKQKVDKVRKKTKIICGVSEIMKKY